MAGWNNRNCCCEPKLHACADGEVDICCMTLQASTWAQAITLFTRGLNPDDVCGYTTSGYSTNNACGRVDYRWGSGPCSLRCEVWWGIQADGTVKLNMQLLVNYPTEFTPTQTFFLHQITGLDPADWFLSPVSFVLGGVTYTLEVCSSPPSIWEQWPKETVYLKASVISGPSLGMTYTFIGDIYCGGSCSSGSLNPNPYGQLYAVQYWQYDIRTDEIWLFFPSGVTKIPFDDGNWINSIPDIPDEGSGNTWRFSITDSCDIPPPPSVCEWENPCWLDLCPCLVDGSADPPVLYRTIYADVSGSVTATGLALLPDDPGGKFTYSSGADFINIICQNGGLDPYTVTATISGNILLLVTIPAGGLACSADGSQMVDETVTDGFMTIRFYTL